MEVMKLDFYREVAKKFNLKIKYLGYYGGFQYNWGNKNPTLKDKIIYAPFRVASKILKSTHSSNRLTSSYIVFIAEKNGD